MSDVNTLALTDNGSPIELNLDALIGSHLCIQANSGAGKSGAIRKVLEVTHGRVQHIVIDTEDEFYTLREKFEYLIAGGDNGDCAATTKNAAALATTILETGFSAIVQINSLPFDQRCIFIAEFLSALTNAPKRLWRPALIVLDEAQFYCLDTTTELLTDEGWRKWDAFEAGDRAACFDLTSGRYSFEEIQRKIVAEYDGEMCALRTQSLDCLMTPEHRVVLRKDQRAMGRRKRYPWTFCDAANVPHHVMVPAGGAPCGSGIDGLSLETCRILGWMITDGHYHDKRATNLSLAIEQSLSTTKVGGSVSNMMDAVFSKMPGVSRWSRRARTSSTMGRSVSSGPASRWYLSPEASAPFLKLLGTDIHRIPRLILRVASFQQLEALFTGLMEGDGTSRAGKWIAFYPGKNEGLADDFQELALRLGWSVTKTFVETQGQWHLRLSRRPHHSVRKPKRQSYKGTVWDITVPTGAFVARRNGKVFVTGNCPQKGYATSLDAIVSFMMLGRKRGFTGILATPRPADLSKQATSPVNNWMVGRCGQPADRRSAADALGFPANSAEARNLRSLVARQFWVFGPALTNEPTLARIEKTQTTIIKAGQATLPTPPAPAAMQRILASLNAAAVEKKEEAPLPNAGSNSGSENGSAEIDQVVIDAAEQRGFERGREAGYESGAGDMAASAQKTLEAVREGVEGVLALIDQQLPVVAFKAAFAEVPFRKVRDLGRPNEAMDRAAGEALRANTTGKGIDIVIPPMATPTGDGQITSTMKETLHAIAWWHRLGHRAPTRKQIGGLLGIIADGSTMRSRLAGLSKLDLIEYPTEGAVALTAAGKAAAPPVNVGRSIVETVRAALTPTMQETFDAIPGAGRSITREDLGAKLGGIEAGGSTMRSRLSELSNRELIFYPKPGLVARQEWVQG